MSIKVDRLTSNVLQTAALDIPLFKASNITSIFSFAIARGRPPIRPRFLAAANPAFMYSLIRERSNCASAPNTLYDVTKTLEVLNKMSITSK